MYDQWISHWARRNPQGIAVVLPGGTVRYGEFDREIARGAAPLQGRDPGDLAAGSRAAVHVADEYVHWLLLLALDRLGVASASVGTLRADNPFLAAVKPALVLTTEKGRGGNTVEISAAWLEEVRRLPADSRPARPRPQEEIVRVFSSSGTTGTPKTMALNRAQVTARVAGQRLSAGAGSDSRACVLFGPGTSGGYTWPLAFWTAGAAVVLNLVHTPPLGDALGRAQPSHLYVAVSTLSELVGGPAAMANPLPSTLVYVVGSALPRPLGVAARQRLGPHIGIAYGTTEVAGVAAAGAALVEQHDNTVGHILPGVAVEAVDADGKVLPPGVTGLLRMRTPGMISGYLGETPASASAVRDGWFYPDDLGSVSADGEVIVRGRVSDLINIGGDKYAPQAIEDVALSCAGIKDAAAFSVPDRMGVEVAWIAVVRGEDHRPGEVAGKIKARWPGLTRLQIVGASAIPRNQMGKIDRLKLRQQGVAATAKQ